MKNLYPILRGALLYFVSPHSSATTIKYEKISLAYTYRGNFITKLATVYF